ncbi:MAG: DUF58 domain-containing protein [Pseudomonadota bacterium]
MRPNHVRGRLQLGERFPTGMRPGRRRAQGSELDSIGPYVPGDDIRWMDWQATARTGRPQMKRFVAESHLARVLILDFRPHLIFGSAKQPMAKTAALLAAQLAWESFILQEPVGLVLVPDGIEVQPRRGRGHVLYLLKHVADAYETAVARAADMGADESHGDDPLAAAIDSASSALASGDEITVFSDFGECSDALSAKARALSTIRKLRAVIIEDAMFHRVVPPGRYPYQSGRQSGRRVATVPRSEDANRASELRSAARRQLIQDGWRLSETTIDGLLVPGAER